MKLRIVCPIQPVALDIATELEACGFDAVDLRVDNPGDVEIRHRGLRAGQLVDVAKATSSFTPRITGGIDDGDDVDIEIRIGGPGIGSKRIVVCGTDAEQVADCEAALQAAGLAVDSAAPALAERASLLHCGAPPALLGVIQHLCGRTGATRLREIDDGVADPELVVVCLREKGTTPAQLRDRIPVEIDTDDPEAGADLVKCLEQCGFQATIASRPESGPAERRLALIPGAFDCTGMTPQRRDLVAEIQRFCDRAGIDGDRYPLETRTERAAVLPMVARLSLPIAAMREKDLAGWGAACPEAFPLRIRTDDAGGIQALVDRLERAGFRVALQAGATARVDGFRMNYPRALGERSPLVRRLRRMMNRYMRDAGSGTCRLETGGGMRDRFELVVPAGAVTPEELQTRFESPEHYRLRAHCPDIDVWQDVLDELKPMAFEEFGVTRMADEESGIRYGRAPVALVDRIRELVRSKSGVDLPLRKCWDDEDPDIWIDFPRARERREETRAPVPLRVPKRDESHDQGISPLSLLDDEGLRFGRVTLPRWPACADAPAPVPMVGAFEHLVLDQPTAELIEHLAAGLALGESVLLEGEPATGKSTAVSWLCARIGAPVLRMNLDGHTDPAAILGKWVPDPQRSGATFRFQASELVQSLTTPTVVILDEINLAAPEVIEALNPLLERPPSLRMADGPPQLFGAGGTPIHDGFRIVGTMNPATYAGRNAMSAAGRSRWAGARYCRSPGFLEVRAMLRHAVYGEHPVVELGGSRFRQCADVPAFSNLAGMHGIEPFLDALAQFHCRIAAASEGDGDVWLGEERRDGYVFSRRTLTHLLRYLDAGAGDGDCEVRMRNALDRYYCAQIAAPREREAVVELLEACGLGADRWLPDDCWPVVDTECGAAAG